MKFVIAPDKFKGSLGAADVAGAMAAGARSADPTAQIDLCPLADGGEGTVAALVAATNGRLERRRVTGPLPEMKVDAMFGLLGDGQTAVIEMAAASGIALLSTPQRNPLNTTTFGTGELIMAAIELGARHIILGIGGSATVDGGIGAAQACGLGIQLSSGQMADRSVPLVGRDLPRVAAVATIAKTPLEDIQFTVACDVTNPLAGPQGAAPVFGPQKGATPEDVRWLDDQLSALAERLGKMPQATAPGAGAAGGLGFGAMAFLNAKLVSGIRMMIDATKLRERLSGADLCLTGEGCLDAQTLSGKVIAGVAQTCRETGVPCIAIAGTLADDLSPLLDQGITAWFSICDSPMPLEQAMRHARRLVTQAAGNVVRTALLAKKR